MSSPPKFTEPFPQFSTTSNSTSSPISIPGPSRRPPRYFPSFSSVLSNDGSSYHEPPNQPPAPPPSFASSTSEQQVQSVPDMNTPSSGYNWSREIPDFDLLLSNSQSTRGDVSNIKTISRSQSPPLEIPDIEIPEYSSHSILSSPSFYDRYFGPDYEPENEECRVEDGPVTAMLSYEGLEDLDPSLREAEMAHRAMVQEDELLDLVYHGGWCASDEREGKEGEENRNGSFPQVSREVAAVRNAVSVSEGGETYHISREVRKEDSEDLPVAKLLKRT